MAPDRARGYIRGMKSTLVMLGTVAVVVILIAAAVLVWPDHQSRLYLIGAAVAGGFALAYAGWRWKRDTKGR
jgi:Na+/proline symporter